MLQTKELWTWVARANDAVGGAYDSRSVKGLHRGSSRSLPLFARARTRARDARTGEHRLPDDYSAGPCSEQTAHSLNRHGFSRCRGVAGGAASGRRRRTQPVARALDRAGSAGFQPARGRCPRMDASRFRGFRDAELAEKTRRRPQGLSPRAVKGDFVPRRCLAPAGPAWDRVAATPR